MLYKALFYALALLTLFTAGTTPVSYTHLICIITGRSLRSGLEEALASEEVGIVDEVNLYACGGDGGYLDDPVSYTHLDVYKRQAEI